MLGPAGVSNFRDPRRPDKIDAMPMNMTITAICSGDAEKRRAAAAGIIRRAVIRRTPTIFIETEMTPAIRTMKIVFARTGRVPSAMASSWLTVAANNGRQIAANVNRTQNPPPKSCQDPSV